MEEEPAICLSRGLKRNDFLKVVLFSNINATACTGGLPGHIDGMSSWPCYPANSECPWIRNVRAHWAHPRCNISSIDLSDSRSICVGDDDGDDMALGLEWWLRTDLVMDALENSQSLTYFRMDGPLQPEHKHRLFRLLTVNTCPSLKEIDLSGCHLTSAPFWNTRAHD